MADRSAAIESIGDIVVDALLRGRLSIAQPRVGYRVNVDALILAVFARRARIAAHAIDLGSGVGSVGLALAYLGAAARVTLVDVDAPLVSLARRNADASGLAERVETAVADLRERLPPALEHRFDLVVANPPFDAIGAARMPVDPRRARARVADDATLDGFVRAARAALGAGGRACFVFPARAVERLFARLQSAGLEPKRLRFVHARANVPARVALVEAKPARAGGLRIAAPLIERADDDHYTPELASIVEGEPLEP